jgi:predicted dehydrogenase
MVLRIGCLGAARITPGAILAPAAARDDVRVSVLAARSIERAQAMAQAHGVGHALGSYEALIARADVDIVYIGLPPALHAEWAIKALGAGKHVLCEKPLCMGAGEAAAIAAAARASGRVFMEAYHWRHHAATERFLEMLDEIGPIERAQARFAVRIRQRPDELRWRRELGGGAMMDLGCYPLHLLRTAFAGEPEVLAARVDWRDGVDARLAAQLRFGGAEAVLSTSMTALIPEATATFVGARGRLRFDTFVAPQLGHRLRLRAAGQERVETVDGPSTYAAQLDNFLAAVRGDAAARVSLEDSVAQMQAIDAIYAAAL